MEQNPGLQLAARPDRTASEPSSGQLSPRGGGGCPSGHLGTQNKVPEETLNPGEVRFCRNRSHEEEEALAGSCELTEGTKKCHLRNGERRQRG